MINVERLTIFRYGQRAGVPSKRDSPPTGIRREREPTPRGCRAPSAGPMVRILFPPANSPSLARFLLPVSKSRHLPRPARARPRATAGRDAQGSSTSPQLPVTSLSGPFPVPQCRLGRFADRGRSGALSELGSPRDWRCDQALSSVRLRQCQARSAARASQVADVNVPAACLRSDRAAGGRRGWLR